MAIEISVENHSGSAPLTVMQLAGELDASNYQDVITRVQELYQQGTRRLLLDLSNVTFLSSAGLVALHSAALILRGQRPLDPESGWGAFHAISNDLDARTEPEANFKLLSPQPRVARALEMSGFSRLLPIFDDRDSALASFVGAAG